jgi:SAM-dependent methyltransferase
VTKTILHAGCGSSPLPDWLDGQEVRLDIDPRCKPDIIASLTDLGDIGKFDITYCSHCLEHLHPEDGQIALSEFRRVLNPGGVSIFLVPNLEDVRPTEDVVYLSPAGPITGLDMFYGYGRYTKTNPYMEHKTGFTQATLTKVLERAKFDCVKVEKAGEYDLLGIAGIAEWRR